jgi:outer membrane protein assembly factor BamB
MLKRSFSKHVMLVFITLVIGLLILMIAHGQGPIPPEVKQFADDWPLPNKDYANTRATFAADINSHNINNTKLGWSAPINATGAYGGASSNPLILGKTIYFQDIGSNLFSIKLDNGALNWQKIYNLTTIGPNGPVVGWGKVFATKGAFNVTALDLKIGKELWVTNISTGKTVGIDIQPTVYNDKVYVSTVPGSNLTNFYTGGGAGVIYALDQRTGKVDWNFSTVDSANIWGNKEINSGGGCWYTPSIDLKTNVIFWGVGNPAPWPGTPEYPSGSSRPGPNLYTDSILALNSSNGKLIWYSQVNPHDILDHDLEIPPILAEVNIGGKLQKIVIGAGKMGRVYAFNRSEGNILWTAIVGEHLNDQLARLPNETIKVYPGYLGGIESPMAYAKGIVFVPYVDLYVNYTGSRIVSSQKLSEAKGGLAAIQVETGKIIWDKKLDSLDVGGATVVNDLVLTATFDGIIYAFIVDTGDQVWKFKAPAGINAWPAVAGNTIVWPCGSGGTPALIALKT